MATFQSFEDIGAWQKARTLTKMIYDLTNRGALKKDFSFRDQLRRCSVSIMANIAEGFERSGTREFVQFLSQAKASAGELRSHLYVAFDLMYIDQEPFLKLNDQAIEIARMIGGLIQYLRKSTIRGSKF